MWPTGGVIYRTHEILPCFHGGYVLAHCDRDIATNLSNSKVSPVFRYVDDYLVLLNDQPGQDVTREITSSTFVERAQELKLTDDLPKK